MARPRASPGWSKKRGSHRTFRCSTTRTGRMARSRVPTSCSIPKAIDTPVRQARNWFSSTYVTPRTGITSDGTRLYRASKKDCDACEFKMRCCPNTPARKIPRDLHEDARDVARALTSTPEYEKACFPPLITCGGSIATELGASKRKGAAFPPPAIFDPDSV